VISSIVYTTTNLKPVTAGETEKLVVKSMLPSIKRDDRWEYYDKREAKNMQLSAN